MGIKIWQQDIKNIQQNTLFITYPRTVEIVFGNYPYFEDIENLKLEIKNKIQDKYSYESNVYGGKTDWVAFNDHPLTQKFINYVINKHWITNNMFEYFKDKYTIAEAWGNEIKKGDHVEEHTHLGLHCILYLTEGTPLILRELNIEITPKPGDYYFFPGDILHGTNKSEDEQKRYNLVINFALKQDWSFQNSLKIKNGLRPKKNPKQE